MLVKKDDGLDSTKNGIWNGPTYQANYMRIVQHLEMLDHDLIV